MQINSHFLWISNCDKTEKMFINLIKLTIEFICMLFLSRLYIMLLMGKFVAYHN